MNRRTPNERSIMSTTSLPIPGRCWGMLGLAFLLLPACYWLLPSVKAEDPKKKRAPEEKAALEEGQALFRGLCSGCHGGAGRGGKGPDLTRGRFMHGNKDEDIAR